ncbi:MAG: type III pantothenate kinase [Chloroflexota bacterium]|nr:type III pantothenate kinase [Chloroflexota bacterium]
MLLCVDIGNTNIVMGLYEGNNLLNHWRVSTDHNKMPDEYGMLFIDLLRHDALVTEDIDGIVLASVVPPVTEIFTEMLENYVGGEILIVGSGIRTGVAIRYDNPQEVGADRVVNAIATYRHYGGPACVIDFGTGTTFDAISTKGEYLGGAIAPGIRIAAEALFQRTAKLPRIDLIPPAKTIGTNTADSMRSGILYGYVGLVEGMVARFRQTLGPDMRVIATGGFASIIGSETKVIEHVDPWLTLKGLRIIYDLNRERKRI